METNKQPNPNDNLDQAPDWPQRPTRPQAASTPRAPYGNRAASSLEPTPLTKETQIIPPDDGGRTMDDKSALRTPHSALQSPIGTQYERQEAYDSDYINAKGNAYNANTVEAYLPKGVANPPSSVVRRPSSAPNSSYISTDLPKRKRPLGWLLWVLVGLLAVGVVGALAVTLAWQGQYVDRVYAGVSVLGVDMGGKTNDEAKAALRDKLQGFVAQPVTLTWQGKEWKPNAEQLGVKIDVDSSVDEAFDVGRSNDFFGNAAQQWYASQSGHKVPLAVQINEPEMQDYLNGIAQTEIDQELSEGDVRLDGTEVVALPGKEGRTVRVYDAIAAIRESVAKLEPGQVALPVDVVRPNISAEEVEPIKSLLSARVSAPITATVLGGETLTLDRDALALFTTVKRNPDPNSAQHVMLGWDEDELATLGDRWADEAKRPAKNARFGWNNGALSVLSESADGFETDAKTVIAAIKEHADAPDKRDFELPGKVVAPAVSSKDIGALGVKELLGKGSSSFKGSSAERATNIKVAADLLDGAVVPPGGTFSFLDAMGGIDEDHGFVEGYVIAAERTQRGVGGGVCQVSTTAFRAAFWSGVDITERNQHTYRVGWYEANEEPVGFDAAVFDPGVDMKFVNDTPGYILIETVVGSGLLTVNFYGTKPPGEVSLEGPAISNRVSPPPDVYQVDERLPAGTKKQVETARGGLDTTITRRISVPGQEDKVEKFRSSYKAWANWYVVASASQIPGWKPPTKEPEAAASPTAEGAPGVEAAPEADQPTQEPSPMPESSPTSNP